MTRAHSCDPPHGKPDPATASRPSRCRFSGMEGSDDETASGDVRPIRGTTGRAVGVSVGISIRAGTTGSLRPRRRGRRRARDAGQHLRDGLRHQDLHHGDARAKRRGGDEFALADARRLRDANRHRAPRPGDTSRDPAGPRGLYRGPALGSQRLLPRAAAPVRVSRACTTACVHSQQPADDRGVHGVRLRLLLPVVQGAADADVLLLLGHQHGAHRTPAGDADGRAAAGRRPRPLVFAPAVANHRAARTADTFLDIGTATDSQLLHLATGYNPTEAVATVSSHAVQQIEVTAPGQAHESALGHHHRRRRLGCQGGGQAEWQRIRESITLTDKGRTTKRPPRWCSPAGRQTPAKGLAVSQRPRHGVSMIVRGRYADTISDGASRQRNEGCCSPVDRKGGVSTARVFAGDGRRPG